MDSVEGRVAIITGAASGSGFGRAMAEAFAAAAAGRIVTDETPSPGLLPFE